DELARRSQLSDRESEPPARSQPVTLSAPAVTTFGSRTSCSQATIDFRMSASGPSCGLGGDQRTQDLERSPSGPIRVVKKWVKFNRQPALVACRADRTDHFREIDGAGARNHVMMNPRRGNVLKMVVARVLGQPGNASREVFRDAVCMAHVKVESD